MDVALALSEPAALVGLLPDLGAYAWAFGQGVLVDLTPCVYPLIPITVAVFGAKGVSRRRALFLASAYVAGMAILYTTLGVVVALTGAAFGTWLANPWVVIPIAALLLVLAASMFGAFDIQLPTSFQNKVNAIGGAGPVGAFLMGLVSGLISAPCTGPVLLSLLAYIAQASAEGQSVFGGASLLFVYALGMGTLFFAVALGASLFRPGPWMAAIKSVFGIALLVMAVWFLRPLSPEIEEFIVHPQWGMWIGAAGVVAGIAAGGIHLSFGRNRAINVRKGIAVASATVGAVLIVNNALYVPEIGWTHVSSMDELEQAVAKADEEGKPLLIDFAATWCMPCKEFELQTFEDEAVKAELAEYTLVKIDVSDPTEDQEAMQELFASETLPSVLVYRAAGGLSEPVARLTNHENVDALPEPDVHFNTFVAAPQFLDAVHGAL